jgi:pimeloyl-ACP methyl ester carboxylesterase
VGVVLLHSGITDARQWSREREAWPVETVAPDLHEGFELREPSILVGNSFGGRIALELAALQPELVRGLVLVAPALPGHESSAELRAIGVREDELYEAGDLEAAADLMVETWVPGAPEAVRAYVREAQLHDYSLPAPTWLPQLDPPVSARLADVRAPVLLVDGELDQPDFHRIADRLERELPDVRARITIEGAHHLPNLERPEAFDAAVLPFLAGLLALD